MPFYVQGIQIFKLFANTLPASAKQAGDGIVILIVGQFYILKTLTLWKQEEKVMSARKTGGRKPLGAERMYLAEGMNNWMRS